MEAVGSSEIFITVYGDTKLHIRELCSIRQITETTKETVYVYWHTHSVSHVSEEFHMRLNR